MTQEQLALAAGMDRPFLVQVENGRRSLMTDRLEDLADALGVHPHDLLLPSTTSPCDHQHQHGQVDG